MSCEIPHCDIDAVSIKNVLLRCSNVASDASSEGSSADLKDENLHAKPLISEEELNKLNISLSEFQDKYRRALAETENVRQRMNKKIEDAKIFGIQSFSKDLLDVADNLTRATESISKSEVDSNPSLRTLYDGLKVTEAQLLKVFAKHGIAKINPLDETFDPYSHEAVFYAPIEGKKSGTVFKVEKIGYQLHSRTIRPAVVGVVK